MIGDGFLIQRNGVGNKGFTLIELLVTLAILGIVISIYSSLYFSGYKTYEDTQKNIDIEQNVRYAMTYIITQINQSMDKSTISPYTYKNGDSGIKIDDQNFILWNKDEGKLYAYGNNGNEIAVNISNFQVTPKSNNIINIIITGENGTRKFTLSTDVYIRK